MNFLTGRWHSAKTIFFGASLIFFLLGCHRPADTATTVPGSKTTKGTISLLTDWWAGPGTCHLPASNRDIAIEVPIANCGVRWPKWIVFTEVPSATTIRFIEYQGINGCSTVADAPVWYDIEFKTRGEYTSDNKDPWKIQSLLRAAKPGAIVDHNLQVVKVVTVGDDKDASYDYLRKLNCIQIRDSRS